MVPSGLVLSLIFFDDGCKSVLAELVWVIGVCVLDTHFDVSIELFVRAVGLRFIINDVIFCIFRLSF